jgi:short-subunit dehydrogenase
MKHVLMTGGNGGIGREIRALLEAEGYKVANIGRHNAEILCDLADAQGLEEKVRQWLQENTLDVLINCAGFGVFDPHESVKTQTIGQLVAVNLTAPMILSNLCLRALRASQGHIINISSIEATRHSRFSALYTATKSGLRDFSLSLFEEVRGSGVKVSTINPDMTKTPFFDTLRFEPALEAATYLDPKTVAQTVLFALRHPSVVSDITLRSPKFGIVKKPVKKEKEA